ncbi:DUF192 domain-containing protein [Candidatus Saccharibacteria bacterium]|jgi:uncharacterized membrane protein (UPF0127 family)|nr:DUF192 domain-containing protein [Candidatus Saccharibacteria bacterium]
MKPKRYKLFATMVVSAGLLLAFFFILNTSYSKESLHNRPSYVKLGSAVFKAKVVENEADRIRGLSGTESLGQNEAMLFIFPKNNRWGIWMKDMNYPIDIIWLNQQKEVVDIERSAQPESYPDKTFHPSVDAKYVLETIAGASDRYGIKIGSKANFELDGSS